MSFIINIRNRPEVKKIGQTTVDRRAFEEFSNMGEIGLRYCLKIRRSHSKDRAGEGRMVHIHGLVSVKGEAGSLDRGTGD